MPSNPGPSCPNQLAISISIHLKSVQNSIFGYEPLESSTTTNPTLTRACTGISRGLLITNDVDGTWGDWTLQEGEDNIYMINNRTGKKFKMNLTEVS